MKPFRLYIDHCVEIPNRWIHHCYELGIGHQYANEGTENHFWLDAEGLSFLDARQGPISFSLTEKWRKFRREQKLSSDLLARAVLARDQASELTMLDSTGGRGYDSLYFLALGFKRVHCFEHNPVIYLLLVDAMEKLLRIEPDLQGRIFLHYGAVSHECFHSLQTDISYYDPMYPENKRARLSGKEMMWIKNLQRFSPPEDELSLFNFLMSRSKRVVVKRPPKAKNFHQSLRPESDHPGKGVRYERYKGKR